MCGIAGIYAYGAASPEVDETELIRIRDRMVARGPDGVGLWLHPYRRVGLAHRRLAIIDLHARALQPMHFAGDDLTIVFNGEIYNYQTLRAEIEQSGFHHFRTASDTEVLLALYARYGAGMLDRLRGMFAFAIHDRRNDTLFLARDPYGIKPLYFSNESGAFRFASSVKALIAGGGISHDRDPAGLVGFQLLGSVPEPFTIYRAVSALPAGSHMTVGGGGAGKPIRWASIAARLSDARAAHEPVDAVVAQAALDSVRAHMVADVEVGTFLSAGTDSGALLGLMRDAGASRVRAITIGFEELIGTPADEVPIASEVARHYGAEHHVETITRQDFADALPQILDAMDQPSIDGINSWFVSRAASKLGLKVVLSGLGGDELLAGYSTFSSVPRTRRLARLMGTVPFAGPLARSAATTLVPGWAARNPKALGVLQFGRSWAGAYLLRRAVLLPSELSASLDDDVVREGLTRLRPLDCIADTMRPDPKSDIARVAALETSNYMRNQLLRDSDWASMAHSLELRTPLVDWELLRQIAPVTAKLASGAGKAALAKAPSRPLPRACSDRARTGFTVPIGQWLNPRQDAPSRLDSRAWSSEVAQAFA
ncbi:MAG: asparagine synthase (glutamine-hydrolyzing) [Sphingomonas sp.]|uniref:asparagine synthase (glutamine-hydrolyzing) n=1 Tax=Sphingomonas sp. TaxID=28214 RepID=UPI001ACFF6F2|nr:asparagine synthase (glutamine-hydrolyzing) [Sphingomonas sp.]MBN8806917.1 asparagine synthase (glutamine-hydrolyzing) [Sphingomonas sp.]